MTLRFFDALADAQTILLAGAGGGFDIFAGLPLYKALTARGKRVHLANLSFSTIYASTGKRHGTALVEVTAQTEAHLRYFPELHLARWLATQGEPSSVWCLDRVGVKPLTAAYTTLCERLEPDAIVLVDGGTDSLMRGDEVGLGTPTEDAASLAAVASLPVATKLLACIGFGVDTFHGVCHAHFLEAVAALTQDGAFLGAWSLLPGTDEATFYKEAAEFVFAKMPYHPSIVNGSILAAVDGAFGDVHASYRTNGSELFVNPLMGLYWGFQADAVAARNLYLHRLADTDTRSEIDRIIEAFRDEQAPHKPWTVLPM